MFPLARAPLCSVPARNCGLRLTDHQLRYPTERDPILQPDRCAGTRQRWKHARAALVGITERSMSAKADERPRLRDLGISIGEFPTGRWNAITDVPGVRVGHVTLVEGDRIRTGVTAILPHDGNLFRQKVPAAIHVGNGFGKLIGFTQVEELGEIETPILLTNTLSVWDVAIGVVEYMLALPGNESVRSINPVVGETNDGYLNDIRSRHVRPAHAVQAIKEAKPGPVEEGGLGAGTGTVCFGFKGGIGTSSRVLPPELGGYVIGVLVQTNFGGKAVIAGNPIWLRLGEHAMDDDGSCMIVVATNAPLDAGPLKRLAKRALAGMARTGASFSHGSGDYVIAFSTDRNPRDRIEQRRLDPLFVAVADATEEAIVNSLLRATDMSGFRGRKVRALPIDLLRRPNT